MKVWTWVGIVVLSATVSAQQHTTWRLGTHYGVPARNGKAVPTIFINTAGTVAQPVVVPPGVWTTLDLSNAGGWNYLPDLPETTIAVTFKGIMLVTNATNSLPQELWRICQIHANFRAPNDDLPGDNYQAQAIAVPGDGDRRDTIFVNVPVVHLKTEFYWWFGEVGNGQYTPEGNCNKSGSAVGLNLGMQEFKYQVGDEIDGFEIAPAVPPPPPPPPPPPTDPVSATVTSAGIVVAVLNPHGLPMDWVGLYRADNAASPYWSFLSWQYLNGTHTAPPQAIASGAVLFPLPPPGRYIVHFLENNGYSLLASSHEVIVP